MRSDARRKTGNRTLISKQQKTPRGQAGGRAGGRVVHENGGGEAGVGGPRTREEACRRGTGRRVARNRYNSVPEGDMESVTDHFHSSLRGVTTARRSM